MLSKHKNYVKLVNRRFEKYYRALVTFKGKARIARRHCPTAAKAIAYGKKLNGRLDRLAAQDPQTPAEA